MSGSFSPVDLTGIPAPRVVETLDFETIVSEALASLQSYDSAFTALVESDPAYKILEVFAYREMLIRQRVNDAAKAVLLTYAIGTDLENLGALFGVTRLTLDPGDPNAFPPVDPTYETDASLRYRITLALEGLSTAGPEGAYIYHALKTATIKDVAVAGPPDTAPGTVRVTILSSTGQGSASSAEISSVQTELNADSVRPLTDLVYVQSASILTYTLAVKLFMYSGPDPAVIAATAQTAVQAYCTAAHKIGQDIRLSAIYAAAQVSGVEHVELQATGGSITGDLIVSNTQAAFCTGITVTTALAT
jgi:phage-related baseplate assembly protein